MFALILAVVMYVFGSLGYYTIAQRRGIQHAWLAWVPVGNAWVLGCISDHYRLTTRYTTKNKRTLLLVLQIVLFILLGLMLILATATLLEALRVDDSYAFVDVWKLVRDKLWELLALYLVLLAVAVWTSVVQYMALYDVFNSCDPDNSMLFLLLSIFLGISPFLVFAGKNKDLGMPPKEPQPPMYGYQPMRYAQPTVPPTSLTEPWEQRKE